MPFSSRKALECDFGKALDAVKSGYPEEVVQFSETLQKLTMAEVLLATFGDIPANSS